MLWQPGNIGEDFNKSGEQGVVLMWLNEELTRQYERKLKGWFWNTDGWQQKKGEMKRALLERWRVTRANKEQSNEWERSRTIGRDALIQWYQRSSFTTLSAADVATDRRHRDWRRHFGTVFFFSGIKKYCRKSLHEGLMIHAIKWALCYLNVSII